MKYLYKYTKLYSKLSDTYQCSICIGADGIVYYWGYFQSANVVNLILSHKLSPRAMLRIKYNLNKMLEQ